MTILQIAVASPLRQLFDYLPPVGCDTTQLTPGMRVRVPFRKKETIGVLMQINAASSLPNSQLKQALEILDDVSLFPDDLMQLLNWASSYYHHPIGEVASNALPIALRHGKPTILKIKNNPVELEKEMVSFSLNTHQQTAISAVNAAQNTFKSFLLDGVTGSGKTEVYLGVIETLLQQEKQALVLVPEIGLTPQLITRFQKRFTVPLVALHSGLTEKQRLNAWLMAKQGIAKIIIGTRSAIFTPLLNPGIIIIDEEHDLSFKQQDGFRYSARDLALVRARLLNIPILLGSATPSFESLHNHYQHKHQLLKLPERAGKAIHPRFDIVDLRNQPLIHGLAPRLIDNMREHLQQGNQVLLFLNRRGFAPTLICHGCGWTASCSRCDAHLTVHYGSSQLLCHHCGATHTVIRCCPQCHSLQLQPVGAGTERLEYAIAEHFPNNEIVRIDRDTTRRKGSMQAMLDKVHNGKSQILIGTQMLTKGHHFPEVTFVGILNVDNGLLSADFRAPERTAQLLIQVAGRAGRADKPGEVFIQTYHPQHPLLLRLIRDGYRSFAEAALQERQHASLPPYYHMALLRSEAVKQDLPALFLEEARQCALTLNHTALQILGPVPAPMERRAGRFRAQLLLQSPQRATLHSLLPKLLEKITQLKSSRQVRWSLDVDPQEMF